MNQSKTINDVETRDLNESLSEPDSLTKESMNFDELASLAMSRSRIYGLLGAMYSSLPDEQFVEGLLKEERSGFLSHLSEMKDLPEDMQEGMALICHYVENSQEKTIEELKTEVSVDRTRLFRGVKPGYGPLPPYETVYTSYTSPDEALDAYPLVEVKRAYADGGVFLPEESRDQVDYIGLELDFMRHLCLKESEAWNREDSDEALEFINKEQSFFKEHIYTWVPRFCDVVSEEARLDLYQGVALTTKGFLADEALRLENYSEAVSDL